MTYQSRRQGAQDQVNGMHIRRNARLASIKAFVLILDGKNGSVYFQPRKGRPPRYDHNRLGAVFVPVDGHTNQAVARVVQRKSSLRAGVRDGDIPPAG